MGVAKLRHVMKMVLLTHRRSAATRYGVAVAAVGVALVARLALDRWLEDRMPYATFFIAVTAVAWFGGLGPSLVSAGLGFVTADWFFIPPRQALGIETIGGLVEAASYFGVTLAIALFSQAIQSAREQALARQRELEEEAIERKRAQEKLAWLASFPEQNPNPIVELDLNSGTIHYANPAARRLLPDLENQGLAHPWLAGLGTFASASGEQAGRAGFREMALGTTWYQQSLNWVAGGQRLRVYGEDISERHHAGELLHSQAKHLEALVGERTAKLQESISELEHFSYALVHDLRAPLRAMQGFAQMAEEECAGSGAASQEYLRRIRIAAGRMDRLVQDALNYSKAVTGQLPQHPVALAGLLRGLVETYPNLGPAKAEIQIEGQWPLVLGNEAGLTQCFANLLDNAVKFVPPGTWPQVRVRAEPREDRLRIWVEDNGIGIPRSAQDRLFGMFQRHNRDYEGTGMGLAIVRKVAERMGGSVGVESAEGRGSRFWLELARAPG